MILAASITERIEAARPMVAVASTASRRSELGQFMTPAAVARFMASLFAIPPNQRLRLLDPGAGQGALSAAFIQRWRHDAAADSALDVTAYEIDDTLRSHLMEHLEACQTNANASDRQLGIMVQPYDFIQAAVHRLEFCTRANFTHAILNPPYKKINQLSPHRHWLRQAGIETVNLYSAFMALALDLLVDGGELVAIVPRSFCNGPYYRPFREFMLRRSAIDHIHLFASRTQAFKDDGVLQENIIIKLTRGKPQGPVTISHSCDSGFDDYREAICDFRAIVKSDDAEKFIHIPVTDASVPSELGGTFRHSLAELGVEVSTGPVVDFRLKPFLRSQPAADTVPLLYPCHFTNNGIAWPLLAAKKPNALLLHQETQKWLYPNGFYTVVRRFSSKEEKRRVMASVVRPDAFDTAWLGFENHLNVFHQQKHGIPETLALGLMVFLNSTRLDEHFRLFNGHTQVNATDLRSLKYPSRDALLELGAWAKQAGHLSQPMIDERIGGLA